MKSFSLVVSSPGGDLYRGVVESLSVRGTEGELAVLAGHIPFVTAVIPSNCVIVESGGNEKHAYTEGGILTVGEKSTVFLTGGFNWNE